MSAAAGERGRGGPALRLARGPRRGLGRAPSLPRLDAPASKTDGGGLERPIAAKFDPSGKALYIVDYGVMLADASGIHPAENTGVLWKITREESR